MFAFPVLLPSLPQYISYKLAFLKVKLTFLFLLIYLNFLLVFLLFRFLLVLVKNCSWLTFMSYSTLLVEVLNEC